MMEENRYIEFDAKVDAWLKGQLNEEELQKLKSEIDANPDLKDRAQAMAVFAQATKDVLAEQDRELMDEIKSISEEDFKKLLKKKPTHSNLTFRMVLSIAAMFIVIVGGVVWYNRANENLYIDIADQYYAQYDSSVMRSSGDDVAKELSELVDNVGNGKDMSATIDRLQNLYKESMSEEVNEYTNYFNDIAWNLAIAYLKDNKKDEAVNVLNSILKQNDYESVIYQQAEEFLNKLK